MQQQRRIYAREGHTPGVVAEALPEVLSDDCEIVNFLLRILPKQGQLMSSLRENSETIDVDVDLMEWVDEDHESEHHSVAAIAQIIVFNFPRFYKSLSVACEYLRSALSMDQSIRAIHSSQLHCNILNLPEAFFFSNPCDRRGDEDGQDAMQKYPSLGEAGEKKIRILRGRLAAVHTEKQIVKSRTFACTNDNCRLFSKAVTHVFCFLDDVEGTFPEPQTQKTPNIQLIIYQDVPPLSAAAAE